MHEFGEFVSEIVNKNTVLESHNAELTKKNSELESRLTEHEKSLANLQHINSRLIANAKNLKDTRKTKIKTLKINHNQEIFKLQRQFDANTAKLTNRLLEMQTEMDKLRNQLGTMKISSLETKKSKRKEQSKQINKTRQIGQVIGFGSSVCLPFGTQTNVLSAHVVLVHPVTRIALNTMLVSVSGTVST